MVERLIQFGKQSRNTWEIKLQNNISFKNYLFSITFLYQAEYI
jgi:hypothetical protein